jgi:hypothetical protein
MKSDTFIPSPAQQNSTIKCPVMLYTLKQGVRRVFKDSFSITQKTYCTSITENNQCCLGK